MRHLMQPDPEGRTPTLAAAIWLASLILAVIVFLALVHAYAGP